MRNLGYACINTELRKQNIYTSRTLRLSTLKEKGYEYLDVLINKNLEDLQTILEYNNKYDIRFFRMSSEIFPFASHKEYGYKLDNYKDKLKLIGDYAKEKSIRLTMHPGQYTQLSSLKEEVILNSIRDLEYHNEILTLMGLDKNSVMIIHGGGKLPSKEEALERFKINFMRLSKQTRDRIVLENCEMAYTVDDLLPICKELNIPLVLDYHHYNLNNETVIDSVNSNIMKQILETWKRRGIRPKFHVSESANPNGKTLTDLRKHSDIIKEMPHKIVNGKKISLVPPNVDVMLECKLKEQGIFYLKNKYVNKNNKDE